MNEQQYKPNSRKYKESHKRASVEDKKITKVVTTPVTVKKKSGVGKLLSIFVSDDADSIKSYAVGSVLIPAAKKAISDIVTNGIDILLYGESGNRRKESGNTNYVSYRSYYDRDSRDDRRRDDAPKTRFDYDNIVFGSRSEAVAVLDSMCDVIDNYGFVTVADLYDMVELTHPFTAAKYGWTNLSTAKTVGVSGGYILKLPKAMVID